MSFVFLSLELPKLCYHPGLLRAGYRTCVHTLYDEKKCDGKPRSSLTPYRLFVFFSLELPKLCYHPGLLRAGYRTCVHTLYEEKKCEGKPRSSLTPCRQFGFEVTIFRFSNSCFLSVRLLFIYCLRYFLVIIFTGICFFESYHYQYSYSMSFSLKAE